MSPERSRGILAARTRNWLLAGTLVGVSLAALAVLVLTQTRWGRAQVLEFTLRAVAEQLDGTFEVARLEGNLLTGARLYGISLRGPDDEPFVEADSAIVAYSLRTLAADEIVLDRLVLFGPSILLRQMPGDTLWNYDRILGDTVPRPEPIEPRRPLVVRTASMVSGNIIVELPWEPDEDLSPAEQRRETQAALSDTSQILVREVAGGYLRTMRFLDATADLSRVVSAPDELGGTSLTVDGFHGDVLVWRQPIRVQELRAELSYHDEVLRFRAPIIVLPASELAAYGTVEFGHEDGARIDVTLRGERVALADLRPIHPPLPEEGGGSIELLIETRPEGTLYLARHLDVEAPGTRLVGSFGLILNDALRFVDVDLVGDPLRVSTIERILPVEIPVEGLRIGSVEIRQPAS
jgi:hypothetical protein